MSPWCCRPGHSASCPGEGGRGRAGTWPGCGGRWAGSGGSPDPPRTLRGRTWPRPSPRPACCPHQRRSLEEKVRIIRFMAPLRVSEYISIWKEAREHPEDEWKVICKLNQTGSLFWSQCEGKNNLDLSSLLMTRSRFSEMLMVCKCDTFGLLDLTTLVTLPALWLLHTTNYNPPRKLLFLTKIVHKYVSNRWLSASNPIVALNESKHCSWQSPDLSKQSDEWWLCQSWLNLCIAQSIVLILLESKRLIVARIVEHWRPLLIEIGF